MTTIMTKIIELSLLVVIGSILNLSNIYNKPFIQFSNCQLNIRLQVNNDKLQSAPYLIEAIRQIESQQEQHQQNNINSSSGGSGAIASAVNNLPTGNYSTILRHDLHTNQIVNLGPFSASSSQSSSLSGMLTDPSIQQHHSLSNQRNNNNHQHEGINQPTMVIVGVLGAAANQSPEIIESEPSSSRLASLLGQPELIAAENFPQTTRLRNNNNGQQGSKLGANNKPPARALPVTSSHLKRPFGLTMDSSDSQAANSDQQTGVLQQQQLQKATSMQSQQQNQFGASLVSPSVVSDESLAPQTVVRMSDLTASSDDLEKRFSNSKYHELDQAALESWRNSANNNNNNHNDTTQQQSPRVIYPKPPNRSYTHSGRARITVGAGNQLVSSSSSTLALESSRSTDLSPTIYNNRQQDLDIGSSNNSNFSSEMGAISAVASGPEGMSQPASDLMTETTSNDAIVTGDHNHQPAGEQMAIHTFQRQRQNQHTPIDQDNNNNIRILEPTAMGNQSENQHQIIHTTSKQSQNPEYNHSQHDEPIRVIEIPERIVVSADLHKNDDPIEIMPSPPELPPIRLVINRTRVGRPDARCPKEGLSTFEHPSACDKYYYCDDGYLIEQTCPNGLMYGTMYRVKDYCVYRWHADCVDKTIPNPISSPGCRWQYGVFSVQGSPKCTPDYYECIAGRFEVKKCSITGQVYDDRTKACQYAEKVGCPEEIISDFQCPTDDRTNSFWPFPRYYLDNKTIIHCVNDKPRIMRCPENERVDLEHLYCIPMGAKEPVVIDRKVRERQKGTMQPQKNVN